MIVGLDIGGTKIEGVALDSNGYQEVVKYRISTNKDTYSTFFDSVITVINELGKYGEIESIGIGCCGSIGTDGLMQGANILVLNGQDFIGDIHKRMDVPVTIANDADCFALSEFKDGAAIDAQRSCVAIIIGTGCGAGVIINSTLVTGLNRIGGELGHNPLPHFNSKVDGEAVQCYCGSMNCNESFLSGTGFERLYAQKYSKHLSSKEIMSLYDDGDVQAMEHFERYCDQLSRVLATVVNFIDPEVIVLGGGMSNIDAIYPKVQKKLNLYTFNKSAVTQVVKNHHGDSSGVRGAAFLHSFSQ